MLNVLTMYESRGFTDWDPDPLPLLEAVLEAGRGATYLMEVRSHAATMTALQARLARHLAIARTGLPLAVLAERLHISRAAVTQMVNRMARRGLVVRREHPLDGRCRLVLLTTSGYSEYALAMRGLARYETDLRYIVGTVALDYVEGRLEAIARESHFADRWF